MCGFLESTRKAKSDRLKITCWFLRARGHRDSQPLATAVSSVNASLSDTPMSLLLLLLFLKKNTHRNLIGHFWEDLLKFLEIAGEPLGCGQIRGRIAYPAHRTVMRKVTARDREWSRQGLGAGAFGFPILALSLNQPSSPGPVTFLLYFPLFLLYFLSILYFPSRIPCALAKEKASTWFMV